MGKQSRKNKKVGSKSVDNSNVDVRENKLDDGIDNNIKMYGNDIAVFISMAQQLREEGNKLFQNKDYDSAILTYQKALKLLPGSHIDVSYLHSNLAACYMQMGISDLPRAIHECNLSLEVTPKYTKALLKRARCYEALNRFDLALRDANMVLDIEPNNLMATEVVDRVKACMEGKVIGEKENKIQREMDDIQIPGPLNEKVDKKKKKKTDKKMKKLDQVLKGYKDSEKDEKSPEEDKLVVEEQISASSTEEEEPKRVVKLVYGEDIRWAKIPFNCDILRLRETISDRFPVSKSVLVKYKDEEGDMVTITTNEELIWAESSISDQQGAFRLYMVEVNPEQDPFFEHIRSREQKQKLFSSSACIDNWILEFANLFKNYVGFNSDAYLDLHEVGMKLYSEAMEDTVTSNEAQEKFQLAADKFQEMAALALFNWGNVHMSRAQKRVYYSENGSKESILLKVKDSYESAQTEYLKASDLYKEATKIKPDFYEGFLALGQQQYEQAKLYWYYALGTNINLEMWDSKETVFQLYNEAEDNMEKGMKIWEKIEKARVDGVLRSNKLKLELKKTELGPFMKDVTQDEVAEQAASMRSRMNVLWGKMLYERSIMEYKLGITVWHECLEIAIEKFELAGTSHTHIAVMLKNHCSNDAAPEGVGFNIDEIVQAWNEMYEENFWQTGVPSFRLEPLLRRRVSNIFHALEHA